jgi:hypothetical protein
MQKIILDIHAPSRAESLVAISIGLAAANKCGRTFGKIGGARHSLNLDDPIDAPACKVTGFSCPPSRSTPHHSHNYDPPDEQNRRNESVWIILSII